MRRPGAQLVARQQAFGRLQLQVVVFAERLEPDPVLHAVRFPFVDRVGTDHLVVGHCKPIAFDFLINRYLLIILLIIIIEKNIVVRTNRKILESERIIVLTNN